MPGEIVYTIMPQLDLLRMRSDLLRRAQAIETAMMLGEGGGAHFLVRTSPGLYLGLIGAERTKPIATDVVHAARLTRQDAAAMAPRVHDATGAAGVPVPLSEALVADLARVRELAAACEARAAELRT